MTLALGSMVPIGIAFVVITFVISIGSTMLDDVAADVCDYTWIAVGDGAADNLGGNNPLYGANWGCCSTLAAANNCTTWSTSYSGNVTYQGSNSLAELASWTPTLALVVIAAIIIGVLIAYLGRGRESP